MPPELSASAVSETVFKPVMAPFGVSVVDVALPDAVVLPLLLLCAVICVLLGSSAVIVAKLATPPASMSLCKSL